MNDTFENETTQQQPSVYSAPAQEPRAPKKKGWTGAKVTALALSCALIGGIAGLGGSALANAVESPAADSAQVSTMLTGSREAAALNVAKIDTGKVLTAAEVYAANVGSTVGITTEVTTNFFGYQTVSAASGSGFIITEDGYVLTNYHVIESSRSITVSTYDGDSYEAELIGYDESNDIAVLKIDATGLTPVVVGNSDSLNVGDDVIAIGNPLGELTFSLTKGVVSALSREVTLSSNVTMDLIQTDCAINSGNSGGALFNMYGEVVGITNAKYSSSNSMTEASVDNIGFAIPMNSVISIVESIIEKGYFAKPYIGVTISDTDEEMLGFGLPAGAVVRSVSEDSPAAKAGLQENDIITAVNGTELTGRRDMVNAVNQAEVGETLTLTVYRQGKTVELEVKVDENIQDALADEESADAQASQEPQQSDQQFPEEDFQDGWNSIIPWIFGYSR